MSRRKVGLGWYHRSPRVEADGVPWGGTQGRDRRLPSGVSGDPGQVVDSSPDPVWAPRSRPAAVGCSWRTVTAPGRSLLLCPRAGCSTD